jgi:hypothetical protein
VGTVPALASVATLVFIGVGFTVGSRLLLIVGIGDPLALPPRGDPRWALTERS